MRYFPQYLGYMRIIRIKLNKGNEEALRGTLPPVHFETLRELPTWHESLSET